MNVSIIIVSYNAVHFLPQCLDSVKNQTYKGRVKTVVIDTGNDGTETVVKQKYPWVYYIPYSKNDGFGKANNIGIKKYYDQTDYFLILNPDTKLASDNLEKMVSYLDKNSKVSVVSSKLILPDGKLDRGCKRGFPTPWKSMGRFLFLDRIFPRTKLFGGYNLTYLDEDGIHEVDSVKGAYMLVRKKAIDEVGMFDESFFMYGEDLDWCYRFKEKGWKIIYNSQSHCIHYQGISSGIKKNSHKLTKATKETKLRSIRAFHESMHIFYDKHYKKRYHPLVNKIVMASVNIKMEVALILAKVKS
ncbi:hypothetical protein A2X44_01205 [candidate division CPR3 bacterium GWF2_35_18]|nr:MAG: hypothetical protein A2X44_01205 [candidate division CPR3 bacterium GWF2_35_18]OGB64701.1 MAG: hypothetical protein A2250_03755 [candidate division CPR3 bacterium RIFOXYA2_FULL_35_13]OGB78480.1 MAG: hypothetical protein A2296_04995 [candidate division CPR3 bacterium RIFOXYB2_FULL_35_8]OGB80359.1 MAG: hypothetical protein A2011_00655 [candidate division CPR3 bacterium GWE2_35_7]